MDKNEEELSDEEFEEMLNAMAGQSKPPAYVYILSGLVVLALPLAVIFGLNTIFGTGVEYNLLNWVAVETLLIAINNKYTVL